MTILFYYTYFEGLCVIGRRRIFATSDLNELVSHNYVTTFMKIKGSPLLDVISRSGDFVNMASVL